MLDLFEKIVRQRQSCREFQKRAVPDKLIERLLDITRHAPSGYNLQPIHFIVVQDEKMKEKLFPACLKQPQILESSFLVVFAGDRNVAHNNADAVLREELRTGSFNEEKARRFKSYLQLGFTGFWKRYLAPLIRSRAVLPQLPIENMDAWLAKHASLSCMTFMLAATAAGLSTCAMDAFDEKKLKKALGLSRSWHVPIIVAVGYGSGSKIRTSRLPVSEIVTWR